MAYNNALDGLLGTVESTARSAGATYTLNAGSAYFQFFTGNNLGALDAVVLPNVSTIPLGKQFYIAVSSGGGNNLSIRSSGGNEITQIGSFGSSTLIVTCISNSGTGVASWSCSPMNSGIISFSPTISFATPGDLSVSYAMQQGWYMRSGGLISMDISFRFTPTYTTASGQLRIGNLPVYFGLADAQGVGGVLTSNGISVVVPPFPYPASCTTVIPVASVSQLITLRGMGSATDDVPLGVTQFPSGTERAFRIQITGFIGQ